MAVQALARLQVWLQAVVRDPAGHTVRARVARCVEYVSIGWEACLDMGQLCKTKRYIINKNVES